MFDQPNELCFWVFCDKKSVDSELLFAVPAKTVLDWIRVGSSSWIVCDRGLLFFDRSRDYILIEVVTNTFHDFSSVNERVLPVVVIDRPKNSIRRDGYKLEYFRFIAKPKFWGTKLSVLHLLNNLFNDFPIRRMSSKRITKRISYIVNICEDSWSRTKSDHRNLKYSPKEPWSETKKYGTYKSIL